MTTTIDRLRAYYSQGNFNPQVKSTVPLVGAALNRLEKKADIVSLKLEDLSKCPNSEDLSLVLASLPSEIQMSELDRDALLWVYTHYPSYVRDVKRSIASALYEVGGLDPDLLERAEDTATNLIHDKSIPTILKNYDLLNCICEAVNQIDLPPLLELYAKKDVSFSDKRIKDYRLELVFPKRNDHYGREELWDNYRINNKKFDIYLDTPIGIALAYKGEPNAIIGFCAKDEKTLFIKQIQGVMPEKGEGYAKAHSRGLVVLEWEKLLVNITEKVAQTLGFEEVIVQGGLNNTWGKARIRGKERYDKPAKEQGYIQNLDENWSKDLTGKKAEKRFSIFDRIKYKVTKFINLLRNEIKEIKEVLFDGD